MLTAETIELLFKLQTAKRRERSPRVITTVDDPDFDVKLQTAIRQQMAQHHK
ncbi:hypothetical protein [Microcoleus sp. herbarium14]|uniref:hypothetical protein n=1 Tax=Microcoleus sp. herbarium14 TaxID=3055439 RepID=UPI002FD3988C